MPSPKGLVQIGTSGYVYKHWKRVFYPEDLPSKDWLSYYTGHFSTLEINNSFYRLPERSTFAGWRKRSPDGFLFSVKVSRFLTHLKKLKDPEEPLERFLENAEGLGPKLGPLLFQLPPHWKPDLGRLRGLLALRPRRRRFAVEFREAAWCTDEVFSILKEGNAALCLHDGLPDCPPAVTADFVYLRFHGRSAPGGRYTRSALSDWAERIGRWRRDSLDVYAYFNNDAHGYAVENARELIELVDS